VAVNALNVSRRMKREKRLFCSLEEDYSAHFFSCTHREMAPEKRRSDVSGLWFFSCFHISFISFRVRAHVSGDNAWENALQLYNVVHQQ